MAEDLFLTPPPKHTHTNTHPTHSGGLCVDQKCLRAGPRFFAKEIFYELQVATFFYNGYLALTWTKNTNKTLVSWHSMSQLFFRLNSSETCVIFRYIF